MSGIVGILNLDGAPVDRQLLSQMTSFMSFRGPDAQEIWLQGHIGLGHTMLRTAFEAANEKQPLTIDGETWLTADARIDGRADLISELETKLGRRLQVPARSRAESRTPNDAELILYSYEAWGANCVNHLIGDFAFAIWDNRLRRLFCARDHFGVKPFFFAHIGNCLIFSNTLATVRLDPRVSDAVNEIAIGDFLLFGLNQDLSTTAFRDIHRLKAGHILSVSDGSVTNQSYWAPKVVGATHYRNPQDYVERFKELLSLATDDRLRTNRVAVSMSGGLDSTSVAVTARDLLSKQSPSAVLQAYAVVYDSLIPDEERRYSTIAAAGIGLPIHHLAADNYSLYEAHGPTDMDQAEPFLLGPLNGQFNDLLRLFADCGRVTLTGWDGDAFMSEPPNAYFASSAKNLEIGKLFHGMGWFVWSQHRLPPIGFRTRLKRLLGRSQVGFYPKWIDESFSRRCNLRQRLQESLSESPAPHETRPYAMRVLNSISWAPLFESYDPGASRLHLEIRHPLIDLRLVDYLLDIPAVPWCVNKRILKLAMKDKLPSTVLDRPKTPLAGDPALQLLRAGSVRWLDSFEVTPQLKDFVNLDFRGLLTDEETSDGLWANLRLFALNHWLKNSQPSNR
jgi:asparagine synthase (glutamine-hydrolysing)